MSTTTLGSLVFAFFEDYLKAQRGLSTATLKSYRDALRLFLLFVARELGRRVTRVQLAELTAERVRGFLQALESERHNHVRSRNQRLAALKTFFEYLAAQLPERLAEAERVMAIPVKRVPPPPTFFLERDEIQSLFAQLPASGPYALRDRTLLLFLYNTGARVQEVAELRRRNLELERHRVHLHGKGDKWRVCPLWQETVTLLTRLLSESADVAPERPVFLSQRGQALSRFGIYKIVRHHTEPLVRRGGDGQPKAISPHIFRHYLPFLTMSGNLKATADMLDKYDFSAPAPRPSTRHSFGLEIVEEGQYRIVGLIATPSSLRWRRLGERPLFHRKCCI